MPARKSVRAFIASSATALLYAFIVMRASSVHITSRISARSI